MAHYHPDHTLLLDYSAGNLDDSHALLVSCHLHFCPLCRAQLQHFKTLGGLVMESIKPRPVSDTLLDRVLGEIRENPRAAPVLVTASDDTEGRAAVLPRALSKVLPASVDKLGWKKRLPGVSEYRLPLTDRKTRISLYRIKAGARVYQHDHEGSEYTLVLDGCFSDQSGVYHKGDLILRETDDQHEPTASRNGDCLCLAVTTAPVRFTGFWSRTLNPLLRYTSG